MQILEQGQYAGNILKEQQADGILASVSAYHKHQFNDNWHCHVNPHISFVLQGGCSEKKKNQYESIFKNGDAISLAPHCNGIKKLENVPLKPAVNTKNTSTVPCIVTSE